MESQDFNTKAPRFSWVVAVIESCCVFLPMAIAVLSPYGFVAALLYVPLLFGLMACLLVLPWIRTEFLPATVYMSWPFALAVSLSLYLDRSGYYSHPQALQNELYHILVAALLYWGYCSACSFVVFHSRMRA